MVGVPKVYTMASTYAFDCIFTLFKESCDSSFPFQQKSVPDVFDKPQPLIAVRINGYSLELRIVAYTGYRLLLKRKLRITSLFKKSKQTVKSVS